MDFLGLSTGHSVLPGSQKIGYIINQCKKIGLWEPFEKNESSISFTLNGRRLYFKNSNNYKLFRELYIIYISDPIKIYKWFEKNGIDYKKYLEDADDGSRVVRMKY